MATVQQGEVLDGGGIRFSKDFLVELGQDSLLNRIRRPEVVGIALRWGLQAQSPAVQAGLGIGASVGSFFILYRIIQELMAHGGKVEAWLLAGLALFGGIGGWLFFEAFKRGHYLEVRTEKSVEKLRFDRKISHAEIEAFLASVQSKLGWIIDNTSIEVRGAVRSF